MAETIFPQGVSVFLPNEKAPDFVKAELYINPLQFAEFCRLHPEWMSEKGFMKLSIKKSQKGTLYCDVNTYKPQKQVRLAPDGSPYPEDANGAIKAYDNRQGVYADVPKETTQGEMKYDDLSPIPF